MKDNNNKGVVLVCIVHFIAILMQKTQLIHNPLLEYK